MTLKEIKHNLPPEGQQWLDGLTAGEFASTQTMLDLVGEASFVENWTTYKAQVDELRHASARQRHH